MVETSEAVIVGGGAAGCAVAYYLVRSGVKATVVEGQGVASQGSGYAAGGLNPLQGAGIPGPLGPFAWESFQPRYPGYLPVSRRRARADRGCRRGPRPNVGP